MRHYIMGTVAGGRMGCTHSMPAAIEPIFVPPDVMGNIERLCALTEFIEEDRFIMGIDTQYRITDFLQTYPACCIQVAQIFLQLLSPMLRDRLIIMHAEACPRGLFTIQFVGMKKDIEVKIMSRDFNDSCEPFVEVWFEKKKR